MLRSVGYYQDAVQLTAVCIDLTGLKKLRKITGKKLRHQTFSGIPVWDQCMIQRILRKTYGQYPDQPVQIFFFHSV